MLSDLKMVGWGVVVAFFLQNSLSLELADNVKPIVKNSKDLSKYLTSKNVSNGSCLRAFP